MDFNFNSWNMDQSNSFFAGKIPFGACQTSSKVFFRVYTQFSDDSNQENQKVICRTLFKQKIANHFMTEDPVDANFYICTFTLPNETGLLWYDFYIVDGDDQFLYAPKNDKWGGQGELIFLSENHHSIESKIKMPIPDKMWQLTIYHENRILPKWYTHGIMYQIFPDRFAKGSTYQPKWFPNAMIHANWNDNPHYDRNPDGGIDRWDFFGGNLEGIIEKLDYLKSLNINILYLNPIFEARSNHKYDTADYLHTSPEFGDEALFKKLCEEAQKRHIHIILDGVFSHTGSDSVYFNRYGHYPDEGAWQSPTSPYNWYRFSDYPEEYECWWGVTSMPNVEEMSPGYQDFIFNSEDSVIRHWIRAGASGFRLDVADELPDAFIVNLKKVLLEEKSDAILIGEVWEDASRKIAYGELREYFLGNELDAVMNYPFREIILDFILGQKGSDLATCELMALYEHYPNCNFMANMNLIGSHDQPRVLTLLSGEKEPLNDFEKEHSKLSEEEFHLAEKRLMLAAFIQMTFPGVPCIYYGDEAGCEGWNDPYNRGTYPWGKENQKLLSWYHQITQLRKNYPEFYQGSFTPYFTHHEDLLAFTRTYENQTCLCIFNRNPNCEYSIENYLDYKYYTDLLNRTNVDSVHAKIGPLSGLVILEDTCHENH